MSSRASARSAEAAEHAGRRPSARSKGSRPGSWTRGARCCRHRYYVLALHGDTRASVVLLHIESVRYPIHSRASVRLAPVIWDYSRPREGGSSRRSFALKEGSVPKSCKMEFRVVFLFFEILQS